MPDLHEPVIVTDGGPWAEHDMACAVCHQRKAVLELHSGNFQPCWSCQSQGWMITRRRRRWWTDWFRATRGARSPVRGSEVDGPFLAGDGKVEPDGTR